MEKFSIQKHDFENAKKEIKEFSEQVPQELDLKKVDDAKGVGEFIGDWFLGRGIGKDHVVKGEELNELIVQIQNHLRNVNDTQIKLIREFGQVYNALDALDKDYIQAILTSVEAIEETGKGVEIAQKQNGSLADADMKIVGAVQKTKGTVESLNQKVRISYWIAGIAAGLSIVELIILLF